MHIGDDFRRVFARYAGPEEHGPGFDLPPGATYRTPFGVERHGYGYGMPLNRPLLDAATRARTSTTMPGPIRSGWMSRTSARRSQQYGGQYAILGGDWSPFWHDAIDLLAFEKLSYMMYDDPELVDALLEHIVDYYFEVSRRIFDAAADVIDIFFIGNDFGGQTGPLIGEKHVPALLCAPPQAAGRPGPRLRAEGADALLRRLCAADPGHDRGRAGWRAGAAAHLPGHGPGRAQGRVRRQDRARWALSTPSMLIEGTPELARAETRRVLDIMKPGGGYICSPSHDYLLPETPVENVARAVRDRHGIRQLLRIAIHQEGGDAHETIWSSDRRQAGDASTSTSSTTPTSGRGSWR